MAVRLPILTFHDIDERPSVISFSPDVFKFGMGRLREEGYKTISLSRIVECIRKAEPFPDKAMGVTFDDGYRSVYEKAFPVLRSNGMTATVFLTIGDRKTRPLQERLPSFGGREMMSWPEILEMHRERTSLPVQDVEKPESDQRSRRRSFLPPVPVSCR